jgi:tetratricopeptide (TPR) repeat protein
MPFHHRLLGRADLDVARDLGLAGVDLAGRAKRDARDVSDIVLQQSLALLDRAVARDPGDLPALETRAYALFEQRRLEDALKGFEDVLAKAPDREQALSWAAETALALDRLDAAEAYCRRLVERYPYYPVHQDRLAAVLLKRKAWPQAVTAAEAAVRGNPFRPQSRELLITALLETGNVAGAKAEFDVVGVIDPAYQAKLRERFGARLEAAK